MKYYWVVFIICASTQFSLHAQNLPEEKWYLFDADVMGHFYKSNGETLIKTDLRGNEMANYQNSFLGEIVSIDCFKGLINLVYHGSANTAVLLNNQLAPIGQPIEPDKAGFYEIAAICTAADDNFWIADAQTGQLLLIDKNMQIVQRGAIFTQYMSTSKVQKMSWRNNNLIIINQHNEVLFFDQFGTFSRKTTLKEMSHPFISNQSIYYIARGALVKFNFSNQQIDTVSKNVDSKHVVFKSKNALYLFDGKYIKPLNP